MKDVKTIADKIVEEACADWLLTQKDLDNLTVAISMAIFKDRAESPHVYAGRFDRMCDLCDRPPRDASHVFSRESFVAAIEFERRAVSEIVGKAAAKYVPNTDAVRSHADLGAYSALLKVATEVAAMGKMYDGAGDFCQLVEMARAQCAEIAEKEKNAQAELAKTHASNHDAALSFVGGEIAARNIAEAIRDVDDNMQSDTKKR